MKMIPNININVKINSDNTDSNKNNVKTVTKTKTTTIQFTPEQVQKLVELKGKLEKNVSKIHG